MILPSKHVSQDRALLTLGARILKILDSPITVSALWEKLPHISSEEERKKYLHYDTFVLVLDMLYCMNTIELNEGLISRRIK